MASVNDALELVVRPYSLSSCSEFCCIFELNKKCVTRMHTENIQYACMHTENIQYAFLTRGNFSYLISVFLANKFRNCSLNFA